MMIEWKEGSLFESKAEALVNPVNCQGVSGKGLALQFKRRFPEKFVWYRHYCEVGHLRPGELFFQTGDPQDIYYLATKDKWKDPSRLEWISKGIKNLRRSCEGLMLESVAIPAIGCGLGGLQWSDVRPLIEAEFGNAKMRVEVYQPRRR